MISSFRGVQNASVRDNFCELPRGVRADFAIGVNDDECSPYIERGGLAYISRGGALYDGDVGLFMLSRGVFIRQYCEDWAGNSHFLTLNRALRRLDMMIPAGALPSAYLIGHVVNLGPIPLPER